MQKRFVILFILFLISNLSGCGLIKRQDSTLSFTAPENFIYSGKNSISEKWWQDFNDPALNTLVETALGNNFSLQAALNRLQQVESTSRTTASSLYPTLAGEGTTQTESKKVNGTTSSSQSFLVGLTASYEVDLWGRVRSLNDAAQLDVYASSMDLETAAITLSSQVATTWYQLNDKRNQLKIIDQQIATNTKSLELIKLQFRTGNVGISDVLQQQQVIEANKGERAQGIAERDQTFYALNILLGKPPTSQGFIPETVSSIELTPLPKTGLPAELIKRRPDLQSAFFAVQAADARVAAAIAAQYPALSISAKLTTSGSSTRDLFNNWLTSLAANLIGPIFDAGERASEADRQKALASEKLNRYSQNVLIALGEVENALIKEEQQQLYITSINHQLELAQQSMQQIKHRYLQGVENYQRVLTALVSLQNLQQQQLTARLIAITNRIELCRALAGGWEFSQENSIRSIR